MDKYNEKKGKWRFIYFFLHVLQAVFIRDSRISAPNPARRNRSYSHAPDAKHIVSLSLPHTCNLYGPGRFRPQGVLPCVSLRHVLLTKWHTTFVTWNPSIRRKIGVFSTFLSRLAPKRPASCGEKSGFLRRKKCFLSRMKNFLLHKNRRKEGKCTQSGVCFKVGNKNIILLTAIWD